ncbi:MAG: undecaprenyl-phosphate glucose phosphotransferase [Phycisphaerales bacterium]
MLKQRHQLFVTLFAGFDGIAVGAASLAALWTRSNVFAEPFATTTMGWARDSLMLVSIPVVVLTLAACRLYRPRRDRSIWGELWEIARAGLLSAGAIVVALWAVGSGQLSGTTIPISQAPRLFGYALTDPNRFQLVLLAILIPAAVGSQRFVVRIALRWIRKRGWNMRHVAVVGTGRLGQITAQTITRNAWTGIRVSYMVSHHPATNRTECAGIPVRGGLDILDQVLEASPVDAVYVSVPGSMGGEITGLLRRLERHAVDVRIVPDVQPRQLPVNMAVSELEGMPILSYRESPLAGVGGVFKRAMDVAGALAAILLFSPVMAVVAVLVRLDSPGPVIFRQTRVSLGGEIFQIYKFRTMVHADQEQGLGWTARQDPRITNIGRWLRRSSLDELPQLFNVLKGDMALVGPRPERPELIDRFRDDWRGYMLRQHVKAGMTGWAQVHGFRGDSSLRKRLQYDLYYIRNWSILLDLRILSLTIRRGFVHQNAM